MWSCPAGNFGTHVSKKMAAGHLWVERLRRNRCPAADGWLGFRYSLMPKVMYGSLSSPMICPKPLGPVGRR